MSTSQDLSRSLDQIFGQLSLANIVVPKIDTYKNVFEFINEFESDTAMLPDDQKCKLLAKAFPAGRYMAWYEKEIKPIINSSSWKTVKSKIIERYSDTEDRDRHLKRLEAMKFNQDSTLKLFDFVEELSYSFSKAFPKEDDDTKIRYIKNKLPSAILPTLSTISQYSTASKMEDFLKGIRHYDVLKAGCQGSDDSSAEKLKVNELVTVLKDLVNGIKQQASSNAVSALMPRSSSPNDSRRREMVGQHNSRRENSPGRVNHRSYHDRSPSPYNRRFEQRSPSPAQPSVGSNFQYQYNHEQNNDRNANRYPQHNHYNPSNYQHSGNRNQPVNNYQNKTYLRGRSPPPIDYQQGNYSMDNNTNNPPYYRSNHQSTSAANKVSGAFNNDHYYQRFGYPPTPCANCQSMHWMRHCPDNLN